MRIGEADLTLPDYQDSSRDRIRKKINNLLRTIEGTYPMNRSYGIRSVILDAPLPVAKVMLAEDIYAKSEQYIREIVVTDVRFRTDEDDILYPVIYAELAENEEGDDPEWEDADNEEDEYESD